MGQRQPLGAAACVALLVVLCSILKPAPTLSQSSGDLELLRARALELVNQSRRQHGLATLEPGPKLNEAAQAHAQDMHERSYYSHTSPEGDTVQDRYREAGGSRWHLVAENIARCQGCGPPLDAQSVERLHEGWMNSPPHRENILHRGLDRFGFGIVASRDKGLYAVQTFAGPGTPRGSQPDEEAVALSPEQQLQRAVRQVNKMRKEAGAPPLDPSPALAQAAQSLLPDQDLQSFSLDQQQLFDRLPEGQRAQWRRLGVIAGMCGGCGTKPTAADVRHFADQWTSQPDYRQRLLDRDVSHLGFALATDGDGMKVGLAVLGTHR